MTINTGSTVRLLPPWDAVYGIGRTFYVIDRTGQTCLLNVNDAPLPPVRTDKEIADAVRAKEIADIGATTFNLDKLEEVI